MTNSHTENSDREFHLPWKKEELEKLIKDILPRGETFKVDFKRDFNISGAKPQAEFLKDVSALANTHEPNDYYNYGFIIYGVEEKKFALQNSLLMRIIYRQVLMN